MCSVVFGTSFIHIQYNWYSINPWNSELYFHFRVTSESYRDIVDELSCEFIRLLGWLWMEVTHTSIHMYCSSIYWWMTPNLKHSGYGCGPPLDRALISERMWTAFESNFSWKHAIHELRQTAAATIDNSQTGRCLWFGIEATEALLGFNRNNQAPQRVILEIKYS